MRLAGAGMLVAGFAVAGHVQAAVSGDRATAGGAYPSFCVIPVAPTNIRNAASYKAAVVDVRLAGRVVDRKTQPGQFTLSDTAAFTALAQREATPPPPVVMPGDEGAEAFVQSGKALAIPPRRTR